ncbi:hypothetical protein PS631_00081 [Pseudomonas fluorescens]|uniref:Uncharacterized protein n=1 Tax=Pseudomonas fluorescens TaxID=294 RepID=A0A5E6P179_PSEFL|nr:hypothetical protein [Pseudomonas fluorescens]VVM37003.1 hypothetical protein PS631_00081 [Pseudomonas fluorescens]
MSICLAITDADWALTKDVFSVIGTVFTAIGVVAAGIYGFLGLKTWRRQNKGTADHELSRRVLIDLYRLRDCISQVRNPVMLGNEGGSGEDDPKDLTFPQKSHRNMVRAYTNRFAPLAEIRARLNTALLESEAVWDKELKARCEAIFKLQHELFTYIHFYLVTRNPDEREGRVLSFQAALEKRRDVMYDVPLEGDDEFKKELDAALSHVEDYLRPKLIR